jgi:hypothetical protein
MHKVRKTVFFVAVVAAGHYVLNLVVFFALFLLIYDGAPVGAIPRLAENVLSGVSALLNFPVWTVALAKLQPHAPALSGARGQALNGLNGLLWGIAAAWVVTAVRRRRGTRGDKGNKLDAR